MSVIIYYATGQEYSPGVIMGYYRVGQMRLPYIPAPVSIPGLWTTSHEIRIGLVGASTEQEYHLYGFRAALEVLPFLGSAFGRTSRDEVEPRNGVQ